MSYNDGDDREVEQEDVGIDIFWPPGGAPCKCIVVSGTPADPTVDLYRQMPMKEFRAEAGLTPRHIEPHWSER